MRLNIKSVLFLAIFSLGMFAPVEAFAGGMHGVARMGVAPCRPRCAQVVKPCRQACVRRVTMIRCVKRVGCGRRMC